MFGVFTKIKINDFAIPFVCVLMPILTYALNYYFTLWFNFDFMNILVNALLTIVCLITFKINKLVYNVDK